MLRRSILSLPLLNALSLTYELNMMNPATQASTSATTPEPERTTLHSNISCLSLSVNQPETCEENLALPPEAVLGTLKDILGEESELKQFDEFFSTHQDTLSLEDLQSLITQLETQKYAPSNFSTVNRIYTIIQQAMKAKTPANPEADTAQNALPNNVQKRRLSPEATSSSAQKPHRDSVEPAESFTENTPFEIAAKLYATAWSTWDEATRIPHKKNTLYKLAISQYENYRDLLCSWPQSAQQAFIKKHYQIFNLSSAGHLDTKTKKKSVEQFIRTFIQGQIDLIKKNEPKKKPLTAKPNTLFSKAARKQAIKKDKTQEQSQHQSLS